MKFDSGKCFICGRYGRTNRGEFLCEKCLLLALKHPLFRCSNCGSTGVVTQAVFDMLKNQTGRDDIVLPCVVLTNYCANCIKGLDKIDLKIQIYRLNRDSFS